VPDYYVPLLEERNDLDIPIWVTLADIKEADPRDFLELQAQEELRHPKYIFAFPSLVHRLSFDTYFSPSRGLSADGVKVVTVTRGSTSKRKPKWAISMINGIPVGIERRTKLGVFPKEVKIIELLMKRGPLNSRGLADNIGKSKAVTLVKDISELNCRLGRAGCPPLIINTGESYALDANVVLEE
jgi:hypothetical protein